MNSGVKLLWEIFCPSADGPSVLPTRVCEGKWGENLYDMEHAHTRGVGFMQLLHFAPSSAEILQEIQGNLLRRLG